MFERRKAVRGAFEHGRGGRWPDRWRAGSAVGHASERGRAVVDVGVRGSWSPPLVCGWSSLAHFRLYSLAHARLFACASSFTLARMAVAVGLRMPVCAHVRAFRSVKTTFS